LRSAFEHRIIAADLRSPAVSIYNQAMSLLGFNSERSAVICRGYFGITVGFLLALVLLSISFLDSHGRGLTATATYVGMADASAAETLDQNLFVAADDEVNRLCIYDRRKPGAALATFDLTPHLNLERKSPEVDIEASTTAGQRIYWLSSHGTSKNGKERLNRRRFFATEFEVAHGNVSMRFIGKPYTRLVDDLISAPKLAKYDFGRYARLAPKSQGGLNMEGLATTPSGEFLIGFRSPLYEGRAIVVPLRNPEQLILGKSARFGPPIELELDGLGIRCMTYWAEREEYVILGGPQAAGTCRLFTWSGDATDSPAPAEKLDLRGWNTEACLPSDLDRLELLSDDGVKETAVDSPVFRSASVSL
jgi:Protein of unknown function (DUF3616)